MSQKNKQLIQNQRGAVSLFVVIFTALLVIIVSVSFIRIMIQGQQQATTADLSRSAYDSAQAGVEDAKRALVAYRENCSNGTNAQCISQDTVIKSGNCNTLQQLGVATGDKEVLIKQQEGDSSLQQAYTCVKMQMDSPDYVGTLDTNASRVVPLRGVKQFNRVTLEWFMEGDIKKADDGTSGTISLGTDSSLPQLSAWPQNRPAFIRSQFIQYGSSFELADFDDVKDGKSNANTLFMYPASVGRSDVINLVAEDTRRAQGSGVLQQIACKRDFTSSLYACKATLQLPQAIGQTTNERGAAYLRLNAIYNSGNNFRVQLYNDSELVNFAGVQAIVDSTGRANDQFRRVQSRVELDVSAFPYPEAAVDITGNLCKNFLVTDNPAEYVSGTDSCDPSKYKTE